MGIGGKKIPKNTFEIYSILKPISQHYQCSMLQRIFILLHKQPYLWLYSWSPVYFLFKNIYPLLIPYCHTFKRIRDKSTSTWPLRRDKLYDRKNLSLSLSFEYNILVKKKKNTDNIFKSFNMLSIKDIQLARYVAHEQKHL